jgi:hypothetical protein
MNFKRLLPLFIALLGITFSAARAADSVVVNHLAEAKSSTATIRITDEIKILLPTPNPLPGYAWQIVSNDPRVLRLTSSPKSIGMIDRSTVGTEKTDAPAGPVAAWATSYLALRPGRSIVRVAYVKVSDRGEEIPSEVREITVMVHQ